MSRSAKIDRSTRETHITLELNLDGSNQSKIQTGIGFFDHLLDAFQRHGGFDLSITCKGDLYIDGHHTVEDVGIVLGQAFAGAVGEGRGITRFGHAYCPLDESLARTVVDVSGRPFLFFNCPLALKRVGEFEGELFEEFLRAYTMNARITLHVELLRGTNQHHALEAMMKSLARALKMALQQDKNKKDIPSTKGALL